MTTPLTPEEKQRLRELDKAAGQYIQETQCSQSLPKLLPLSLTQTKPFCLHPDIYFAFLAGALWQKGRDRDEVLEEAAEVADRLCQFKEGVYEDEDKLNAGSMMAANAIAGAIRALKEKP